MKKIQIYYFSGTGNTAFVVKKLTKELESFGNAINVNSCESVDIIDKNMDIIGIVFPIHSSYAPKVFLELLNLYK